MVLFLSLHQNRVVLSLLHQSCLILALFLSPQNLVVFFYFRTTGTFIYLLASEPHGSPIYFRAAWSPPMLFLNIPFCHFILLPSGMTLALYVHL